MDNAVQYSTPVQADETVLQALLRECQLPEAVLLDAAEKGAVWISEKHGRGQSKPKRLRKLQAVARQDSVAILNYDAHVLAQIPQRTNCISDHVNYGIWFKPPGMLCQGSKWSDHTVITQLASAQISRQCHLVHRLDKAARGLLVIAYTRNAVRAMADLFAQRQIEKTYHAVVRGRFVATIPLVIDSSIDERSAHTVVKSMEYQSSMDRSLLMLNIHSGRKHQIRRHLAGLGYPIIGDRLHGVEPVGDDNIADLQLVASSLSFKCPFTHQQVSVSIDANKALDTELYHAM